MPTFSSNWESKSIFKDFFGNKKIHPFHSLLRNHFISSSFPRSIFFLLIIYQLLDKNYFGPILIVDWKLITKPNLFAHHPSSLVFSDFGLVVNPFWKLTICEIFHFFNFKEYKSHLKLIYLYYCINIIWTYIQNMCLVRG